MDRITENIVTAILYISLAVVLIFVVLYNYESPWMIILLSGLIIVSITVRNAIIYNTESHRNFGKLTLLLDIFIVVLINHFDRGSSSQMYYLILIGDAAIAYPYNFSISVTLIAYLSFALESYLSLNNPSLLVFTPTMVFQSLAFIATYAIMYIVKYEITQKEKLSNTMFELKIKTKQLEDTYIKLKQTSEELEEMTILKERNRIAREIHDTVGHTLTTVLLEMEAGERLMKIDPERAAEKIKLAKGQVRKGLGDIRESVRTLQEGREILEFGPSIKVLIDETTQHGDVFIKYEIGELPKLTSQQEKAIYRALQEGLTNGIKHGKSTAFIFKLKYDNNCVKFFLEDNGQGKDKIVQGFGLTAMEQRVKEAGGIFFITSKSGEGCCINISIPINEALQQQNIGGII